MDLPKVWMGDHPEPVRECRVIGETPFQVVANRPGKIATPPPSAARRAMAVRSSHANTATAPPDRHHVGVESGPPASLPAPSKKLRMADGHLLRTGLRIAKTKNLSTCFGFVLPSGTSGRSRGSGIRPDALKLENAVEGDVVARRCCCSDDRCRPGRYPVHGW